MMERINRNEIINITLYIVSITLYLFITIFLYLLLYRVNPYYLFVIIPVLFLFTILSLSQFIKIIITLLTLYFRKNGNELNEKNMYKFLNGLNTMTKNTLIAIFIALLTSIMILDVAICLTKQKIVLLSLSIVVWYLIYSFLFDHQ